MHILYGVVGEGLGHAMRSRVIIQHLIDQGHEVHVMASQRAVVYLAKRFPDVTRIHGMHMIYEENRVRHLRTAWSNARAGALGVPKNILEYYKSLDDMRIDAVISDFESWTHTYAKLNGLPVLSIDNMQIISRCEIPKEIVGGHVFAFEATKMFVRGKLPKCDAYFITSFFNPPVTRERTALFPPILRPEILSAKRREGGHLLVYTTGENNAGIASALAASGIECRVYGMRRGITEEQVEGTLRYRPFSEDQFIDDLASCRAVVAGGGFTLMGEAVYLGKPMLSVPLGGQFEQTLNAKYLEHEGLGQYAATVDGAALQRFLAAVPRMEENLSRYDQNGNTEIFTAVDRWLATR